MVLQVRRFVFRCEKTAGLRHPLESASTGFRFGLNSCYIFKWTGFRTWRFVLTDEVWTVMASHTFHVSYMDCQLFKRTGRGEC